MVAFKSLLAHWFSILRQNAEFGGKGPFRAKPHTDIPSHALSPSHGQNWDMTRFRRSAPHRNRKTPIFITITALSWLPCAASSRFFRANPSGFVVRQSATNSNGHQFDSDIDATYIANRHRVALFSVRIRTRSDTCDSRERRRCHRSKVCSGQPHRSRPELPCEQSPDLPHPGIRLVAKWFDTF